MPVYKDKEQLIETTRTIELSGEEVEEAIRRYLDIPDTMDFSLRFTIPGGGDWSGDAVEADTFREILVKTTSIERFGD